jgi:hypothetical protein
MTETALERAAFGESPASLRRTMLRFGLSEQLPVESVIVLPSLEWAPSRLRFVRDYVRAGGSEYSRIFGR